MIKKIIVKKPQTLVLILVILCAAFCPITLKAQKRLVLSEEEQVHEAVTKEVDALFKGADFIKKKNKKFASVKGYIVVDIAVVQNGRLSSFFKVDSDISNIDFIEYLSELVLSHKFAFKLPKQQRYKIRQTINIE